MKVKKGINKVINSLHKDCVSMTSAVRRVFEEELLQVEQFVVKHQAEDNMEVYMNRLSSDWQQAIGSHGVWDIETFDKKIQVKWVFEGKTSKGKASYSFTSIKWKKLEKKGSYNSKDIGKKLIYIAVSIPLIMAGNAVYVSGVIDIKTLAEVAGALLTAVAAAIGHTGD